MKKCIHNLGFSYLTSFNVPITPMLAQIKQRIHDQILQEQNSYITESSKLSFFRHFCFSNKCAHNVDQLNMLKDRAPLAKLRLSAHNLEIERGRYMQVNREERLCKLCHNKNIEDEKHFILHCTKYESQRNVLISKLSYFKNYDKQSKTEAEYIKLLLNNKCRKTLRLISSFINQSFELRKNVLINE